MYILLKQSGVTGYNIVEYAVSTFNEIEDIPVDTINAGSTVLTVDAGEKYMLLPNKSWEKIVEKTGSSFYPAEVIELLDVDYMIDPDANITVYDLIDATLVIEEE